MSTQQGSSFYNAFSIQELGANFSKRLADTMTLSPSSREEKLKALSSLEREILSLPKTEEGYFLDNTEVLWNVRNAKAAVESGDAGCVVDFDKNGQTWYNSQVTQSRVSKQDHADLSEDRLFRALVVNWYNTCKQDGIGLPAALKKNGWKSPGAAYWACAFGGH